MKTAFPLSSLFAWLCWLWLAAGTICAAESTWKAGTAVEDITPSEWIWMGGYAARTRPAEGKEMDLKLKVLALEDSHGRRGVFVSSDLLGFPRTIYLNLCVALKKTHGLEPKSIILSSSHTHCGPVLRESAMDAYGLDVAERSKVERYSAALEDTIVRTVGRALEDLTPARLASGEGITRFAVNRRNNLDKQVPGLLARGELRGPVDHSVPVLSVFLPDGELKAVLFGYACHNTVMDYYKWSGDYAGFAQIALEKHHPSATALFFMGCGGDQNPLPRRQLALAERYGGMLAAAVEEVLLVRLQTISPELHTRIETVDLALGAAPDKDGLKKLISDTDSAPTHRRWAARLLSQIEAGQPLTRTYPYPMVAWQLGDQRLLLALGGEPVVDYALKFKSQFGPDTWVAGYCNDVMGYIPSLRVLKEDAGPPRAGWGYEGAKSMMPYGLPALRWSDDIEAQVSDAAERLVKEVRASELTPSHSKEKN